MEAHSWLLGPVLQCNIELPEESHALPITMDNERPGSEPSGSTIWLNKYHIPFLEEWLRSNSGGSNSILSKGSSSSSARAIIQAWCDLRDPLEHKSFGPYHLQSLKTLLNSHVSLYLADPQAKLLLSILSVTNISLPAKTYPLFLRLLYIWIKKSSKPSPVLIDSAVKVLSDFLSSQFDSNKNSSSLK
ncbi:hypothetical protein Vadar_029823 [Vaccinium darrowii]|uniref:Uncharacterized protein n=1 Tax=Vaccinium darrowii TaxID=229202 RepID=A0ACB7Y2S7_9ERIC|nr:hypothetical protein Vadar_029823 [Vaccinium darrowii]